MLRKFNFFHEEAGEVKHYIGLYNCLSVHFLFFFFLFLSFDEGIKLSSFHSWPPKWNCAYNI